LTWDEVTHTSDHDQLTFATRLDRRAEQRSLRETVELLCTAYDLPFTDERRAQVAAMDLEPLRGLRQHLITHRTWPQ
jgi:hypothetical protein